MTILIVAVVVVSLFIGLIFYAIRVKGDVKGNFKMLGIGFSFEAKDKESSKGSGLT